MTEMITTTIYKIYGIGADNKEYIYIGSTTGDFDNHKIHYKYRYNKYKKMNKDNNKIKYCNSFIIIDNCKEYKFELQEQFQCIDKKTAKQTKDNILQQYVNHLNSIKNDNIVIVNLLNKKKNITIATIYKMFGIGNDGKEYIYIGSTTGNFCARKSNHKYHHRIYKEGKFKYCSSFIIIDKCEKYNFEKLEVLNDTDKKKIRRIKRELEQKYIDDYKNKNDENVVIVNSLNAFTSDEVKSEVNRQASKKCYYNKIDYYREQKKAYYWANREKRLNYAKNKSIADKKKLLESSVNNE